MAYYYVRLDSTYLHTYGWALATIPIITHSVLNRDRFSIPNRDGELLGKDIWRGNAFVTMTFHTRIQNTGFTNDSDVLADTMGQRIDRLYGLLQGKKKLYVFSRQQEETSWWNDGYYEILGYTITNETRVNRDYAKIEVQFEVYPYKFMIMETEYTSDLTIANAYDDALPLYMYFMSGVAGSTQSLTVNGNAFTFIEPTDLSIQVAYIDVRTQMVYYEKDRVRHTLTGTGDYAKLKLPARATSTIAITSGASLRTYQRWGYKI